MHRIALLMGILLVVMVPAQAGHSAPKVFLRIHVQTAGEGQSAMEVMNLPIPPNGEIIQVRAIPEVAEQQLISVQQDSTMLRLYFNHVGKVDLSAVTAQNQGRILVVLINGAVVYSPIIDQQITTGELDIPHPIPADVLQALQDVATQNVRKAAKL